MVFIGLKALQAISHFKKLLQHRSLLHYFDASNKLPILLSPEISSHSHIDQEELQTSVLCHCCCFLAEYLALASLNLQAQLSDRIHHFAALNSEHVKKLD